MAAGCAAALALPATAAATVVVRDERVIKLNATAPATRLTMQTRTAGCAKPAALELALNGRRVARESLRPRKLRVLTVPVVVMRPGVHRLRVRLRGAGRRCRVRIGLATLGGPAPPKRRRGRALPDPLTAAKRKVPLGAAMEWRNANFRSDKAYRAAFTQNFDAMTPENVMKMEYLQPERGRFDFAAADSLVEFAEQNGKPVHGHTLVWHRQLPRWVTGRSWDRDELNRELERYIKTVVGHYRGRVSEWDVVNEVLDEEGRRRGSVFSETLGADFVANAFRWAHEADPGAKLYINDYDTEHEGPKADAMVALVKRLRADGVPIHGVGLQMHWDEGPPPNPMDVQRALRRYADLGVEVQITEMDVAVEPANSRHPEHLENQARQFEAAALACNVVVECTRFTVWGVSDRFTWRGSATVPLLLDHSYARKPAYDLVRAAFGWR